MQDDRWVVKEEGAATPVATFKTQGQAWEKAKAIARRERSEAVLHGKDGRIRERSLYGDSGKPRAPRPVSPEAASASIGIGYIDLPDGRQPVAKGPIAVCGWAFAGESPVSRVEVSVNGRVVGKAGLCRHRPDVAAALARPDARLAGFECRIDLRRVMRLGRRAAIGAKIVFLDGNTADLAAVEIDVASPVVRGGSSLWPATRRVKLNGQAPRSLSHPVRVLCMERGFGRGGSQLRLLELVRHLGRTGQFECTVVAPTDGPSRPEFEDAGATVRVVPLPIHDISGYDRVVAQLTDWARGRFDVVLGFTLSSFAAIEMAQRLDIPSKRIGEIEPLTTVVDWLGERLDPRVALRSDRAFGMASVVLFTSRSAMNEHRARNARGRFAVLGVGADLDGAAAYKNAATRSRCRRRLGIGAEERILVCAATLWPVKGQGVLVSALKEVTAEFPNLGCALIGDHGGTYGLALAQFVDDLDLGRRLRLLPFREDLREWWTAADAAVCCSESESLSASILEAMAFGLPVLGSRVGGVSEVVQDGVTGWLCEPNDVGSMMEGLRRVARADRRELEALGERAALRIGETHLQSDALWRMTDLLRHASQRAHPAWLRTES
jgi:D-inositol-3-phosphate glycosyltransferase